MTGIILISIVLVFCLILFLVALCRKDVVDFKFTISIPLKLNVEWKKNKPQAKTDTIHKTNKGSS